jgi:hypothetical protein
MNFTTLLPSTLVIKFHKLANPHPPLPVWTNIEWPHNCIFLLLEQIQVTTPTLTGYMSKKKQWTILLCKSQGLQHKGPAKGCQEDKFWGLPPWEDCWIVPFLTRYVTMYLTICLYNDIFLLSPWPHYKRNSIKQVVYRDALHLKMLFNFWNWTNL